MLGARAAAGLWSAFHSERSGGVGSGNLGRTPKVPSHHTVGMWSAGTTKGPILGSLRRRSQHTPERP
ncbi:hypothetical protein BN381_80348 [Candidatus Microthrix parvicella RN1]|uniref:Uncharacterized protein n=1 Tax=Candidatus Neomicrothrix parvicella RN1 TaxID=1229780 RepID=R4Z535_9ACTN|nr:hypothetical protein BN381_80348 [Candidatus Microthrix parvicella RN1]